MAGRIFALVLIAMLALLAVQEIVRFRRAARELEGLPYPRRRLIRRMIVAALFIAILGLTACWPDSASLRARSILSGMMFVAFGAAFIMLFRDLTETSREVVALSSEMDRRTTRELERAIAEDRVKAAKDLKAGEQAVLEPRDSEAPPERAPDQAPDPSSRQD